MGVTRLTRETRPSSVLSYRIIETMTTLLRSAIDRLSRLSKRDQDFYARQLLQELDGDERWDELFALTTDAQWRAMTDEARQDAAENGTLSLDELKAGL